MVQKINIKGTVARKNQSSKTRVNNLVMQPFEILSMIWLWKPAFAVGWLFSGSCYKFQISIDDFNNEINAFEWWITIIKERAWSQYPFFSICSSNAWISCIQVTYVSSCISIIYRLIINQHNKQLQVGLIALRPHMGHRLSHIISIFGA